MMYVRAKYPLQVCRRRNFRGSGKGFGPVITRPFRPSTQATFIVTFIALDFQHSRYFADNELCSVPFNCGDKRVFNNYGKYYGRFVRLMKMASIIF